MVWPMKRPWQLPIWLSDTCQWLSNSWAKTAKDGRAWASVGCLKIYGTSKKTWSIIIAYHRFKYHQSGTFGYPMSRQPRGSRDSNGKGDNQLRHWRSIAHWLNEPIQSTPMD
jgi:hypothetical protein